MKIAYIVPSLANKGPIIVVNNLVEVMTQNGHECIVYYLDNKKELDFGCKTVKITMLSKIDFSEFDVVHSHGLRPDAFVFVHKPILSTNTTFVTTIHNFVFKDFTSEYNRIYAVVFGVIWMLFILRQQRIIVLSETAKKYYNRFLPLKKLHCIPNTILHSVINTEESVHSIIKRFKSNDILLGVNALLTHRKGVDQIIKAIVHTRGVKLCVVGNGKLMDNLQTLAIQLDVRDRVLFLGYQKDAYKYLPLYDIYVMSSRSEGFPLCTIEAVQTKCKVICSDIPLFKELWSEDEVTFFELENIDSLVKAIENAQTRDTTEAAYAKYQNCYSPEAFYNNHIKTYKS